MRILLTWVCVYLFTASSAFGWGFVYMQPVETAGADYSDVLFYHSFETSSTCADCDADYSAGDSVPTCESGVAIDAGSVLTGSNSLDCPSDYDRMEFTISSGDIVDSTSGRIGFYLYAESIWLSSGLFRVGTGSDMIQLMLYDTDDPGLMRFDYYTSGGSGTDARIDTSVSISSDTAHFIEARWNVGGDGDDFEVFVDGVSVGSVDTAVGTFGTAPTTLVIGDRDGATTDHHIDQFFSSSDPDRDIYEDLRTCTDCYPE